MEPAARELRDIRQTPKFGVQTVIASLTTKSVTGVTTDPLISTEDLENHNKNVPNPKGFTVTVKSYISCERNLL